MLANYDYHRLCNTYEQANEGRDYEVLLPESHTISEMMKSRKKEWLSVLQWNADGLATKVTELRTRLVEKDIDVLTVQEMKLHQKYESTNDTWVYGDSQSRPQITYVKDSIVYGKPESSANATDSTTIRVKLRKKKWISISNVYTNTVLDR